MIGTFPAVVLNFGPRWPRGGAETDGDGIVVGRLHRRLISLGSSDRPGRYSPPSINVTPINVNFLLLSTYCTLEMLNV